MGKTEELVKKLLEEFPTLSRETLAVLVEYKNVKGCSDEQVLDNVRKIARQTLTKEE